jgi:hypothetical protein
MVKGMIVKGMEEMTHFVIIPLTNMPRAPRKIATTGRDAVRLTLSISEYMGRLSI